MSAVDSATPSIKPTTSALAPSTAVRYTGSSPWIISEETSIRRLTKPRIQTPRGMAGWDFIGERRRSRAMPREAPGHVLPHECRRMVRTRGERRHDLRRRGRIAERHRDVAKPPFVADAPDRGALEAAVEFLLAPGEEIDEPCVVERVTHREVGLGRGLRPLVPGAHELAVVAAVDAVAHRRPQLFRNGSVVLDGEIGDAAACVELVG